MSSPAIETLSACQASFAGDQLILQGPLFREIWRAETGQLRLISFQRRGGIEWVSSTPPPAVGPNDVPLSWAEPDSSSENDWRVHFSTQALTSSTAIPGVVVAELRFSDQGGLWRQHRFQLHPLVAGSVHQLTGPETDALLADLAAGDSNGRTGGLRSKDNGQMLATLPALAHPLFTLATRHLLAREIAFVDQTDHHSNLVFTREYLIHPGERCLPLRTNLLCLESPSDGAEGFLWLLLAPVRHVREAWSPYFDFLVAFQAGELVATCCPAGYAVARLAYTGGTVGATRALHDFQRAFFPAPPGQAGRLLSNTWGDRAGASHLSEAFVLEEIASARKLGVEIVQIDDGWQKGATVNTVSGGGVWNGFWAADPEFWTPHPTRFPRGLGPLVDAAEQAGIALGLWYAPDSTNDLGNWERDAAQILELWRRYRIAFFKLDAVKLHSRLAESRFHQLCDRILHESGGRIFFDFDATAEHRPTYWGRPGPGALFLENRFTEEAGYHPHQTLRALWTLAHYVRPQRIRAEFLNPSRNDADYRDDPLRPSSYPPEYLFAVTFPTSPLAWFEISQLPRPVVACWQPFIALWKEHRDAFHAGDVLPIGEAPTGYAWTGFLSAPRESAAPGARAPAYALLFRERTSTATHEFVLPIPLHSVPPGRARLLAGAGEATLTAPDRLIVHIPTVQQFLLVMW